MSRWRRGILPRSPGHAGTLLSSCGFVLFSLNLRLGHASFSVAIIGGIFAITFSSKWLPLDVRKPFISGC